jgi:hypothetical protein
VLYYVGVVGGSRLILTAEETCDFVWPLAVLVVVASGQKYHSIVLRPQEPVSDTCIFTAFRTADGRWAPTQLAPAAGQL